MDNSSNRLIDIFFDGLYMEDSLLRSREVDPKNRRIGFVDGYKLRIGKNATLLRNEGSRTYGIIYSLTHHDIYKLYAGAGLTNYVPEALSIKTEDNKILMALSYLLLTPPYPEETNTDYYQKLTYCMKDYGLPIPESA